MENNDYLTEYSTGDVQLPKNNRLPLTALLLSVLFVGSLISALGVADIRIFREKEADTSVRFISDVRLTPAPVAEGYTEIHALGIQGRFLTEFEQRYFDLPQGVYISAPSGMVPGLCSGDVLLAINGVAINNQDVLDTVIESHAHGAALNLQIYRNGHYQNLSAILTKHWED